MFSYLTLVWRWINYLSLHAALRCPRALSTKLARRLLAAKFRYRGTESIRQHEYSVVGLGGKPHRGIDGGYVVECTTIPFGAVCQDVYGEPAVDRKLIHGQSSFHTWSPLVAYLCRCSTPYEMPTVCFDALMEVEYGLEAQEWRESEQRYADAEHARSTQEQQALIRTDVFGV